MRVIAGSARSLPLKTPSGLEVRPTTDRIKETLFNMLAPYIPGSRFLDLFSGSGAIGIEALSRGAASAVFVEKDPRALSCIRENLAFTHLSDRGEVIAADVFDALRKLSSFPGEPFTVVFMDPPYRKDLEKDVLLSMKDLPYVTRDTVFIAEAALDTDLSWIPDSGYFLMKQKKYKTNQHLWLRKN
ncbi:MAG: 16S rRNA (guanine(966)-N(2))-methyltransferase RsmD [Lachnospiraceae bacterium]|nr:16S rRNA (guanine(966)-N(2))-methyltransferase RsmD [Lachnospiraceae bacterium]